MKEVPEFNSREWWDWFAARVMAEMKREKFEAKEEG